MDLHAAQIQGFFNIPVDHLLGVPILIPYYNEKFAGCKEDVVIVSPDFGSVTRARNFASRFEAPIAIVDKRRQRANVCEVMNIIGDVHGKRVILVDDMIDTAGTLCNAARAMLEIGGATEVYACATHGVLSGPAIDRIQHSRSRNWCCLIRLKFLKKNVLTKLSFFQLPRCLPKQSNVFTWISRSLRCLYEMRSRYLAAALQYLA